jgi:hypothetical protein
MVPVKKQTPSALKRIFVCLKNHVINTGTGCLEQAAIPPVAPRDLATLQGFEPSWRNSYLEYFKR